MAQPLRRSQSTDASWFRSAAMSRRTILGLNPATGATEWEWKGLGPGYASPVVIDIGGTHHLVTMTEGSIVGVDAKNGKELWSVPFPDEWHENITTPLWTGSHLIVSARARHARTIHSRSRAGSGRRLRFGRTRSRDVHELAGVWRRLDLRSFLAEERPVCRCGCEDRRFEVGDGRTRRRACVAVMTRSTSSFSYKRR